MNENDSLNPSDYKLLVDIDEIIANHDGIPVEENSLSHLCAQLARTIPEADPAFQNRLKERVLIRWREMNEHPAEAHSSIENKDAWIKLWFKKFTFEFAETGRYFHAKGALAMKKSFVLFIFAAIAIALMTLAFVPPVRAALYNAIKQISLGPNTSVMQIERISGDKPMYTQGDLWVIRTEIGNFGGNAPPGVEPVVQSVDNLNEAQALTDFHLKAPAYLPNGYALREIKLAPIGATAWAILIYNGPGHEIVIAQLPGGPQPSKDPNEVTAVGTGVLTDGTVENVDFDGQSAAWIEGHTLLWESDGISYEVGGLDLNLEEIMKIARSLQ